MKEGFYKEARKIREVETNKERKRKERERGESKGLDKRE